MYRQSREIRLVLVTETDGVLGLVENRLAGAAVNLAVLGAASLVADLLSSGLVTVGLEATVDCVRVGLGEREEGYHTEQACRQRQ